MSQASKQKYVHMEKNAEFCTILVCDWSRKLRTGLLYPVPKEIGLLRPLQPPLQPSMCTVPSKFSRSRRELRDQCLHTYRNPLWLKSSTDFLDFSLLTRRFHWEKRALERHHLKIPHRLVAVNYCKMTSNDVVSMDTPVSCSTTSTSSVTAEEPADGNNKSQHAVQKSLLIACFFFLFLFSCCCF